MLTAAFVASPAVAQQVFAPGRRAATADAALRLVGGHSDNILRQPFIEQSGTYRALGLNFDLVRLGNRVDLDLLGDLEYRAYSEPVLDDEPVGTINANLSVDAVPDRFIWLVSHSYGQTRPNAFVPAGPQNRQETTVFSTGPRVDLPLGQRTFLRFTGSYTEREFENTNDLDSEILSYDAGFYRAISSVTEVGLVLASQEMEYEPPLTARTIDSIFLSYERQLARGNASMQLGKSRTSGVGLDGSAPLVDVAWSRDIGSRSRLSVMLQNRLTDAGNGFGQNNAGGLGVPGPDTILVSADVYELSNADVSFVMTFDRTSLSFGSGASRSRYERDVLLDNDQTNFNLSVQRTLPARMTLGLSASVFDREFASGDRTDVDRTAQILLERLFGRRWNLQFAYQRNSRSGLNTAQPFEENMIRLEIGLDLNPGG